MKTKKLIIFNYSRNWIPEGDLDNDYYIGIPSESALNDTLKILEVSQEYRDFKVIISNNYSNERVIASNPSITAFTLSDTHVFAFKDLLRQGKDVIWLPFYIKENAEKACKVIKFKSSYYYDFFEFAKVKEKVFLTQNDWSYESRLLIHNCRENGIPTVVLQEGYCVVPDKQEKRHYYADYFFALGPIILKYIKRKWVFITGNMKFDSIMELPINNNIVMINSNFTYAYHEYGLAWVQDVIKICNKFGLQYFISKHPRDKVNFPNSFPVYASNAGVVKDHISKSAILVTRASTLAYEALFAGRKVVYYNPFNESSKLFSDDSSGGLLKASNIDQLEETMKTIESEFSKDKKNKFLRYHCTTLKHEANKNILNALDFIKRNSLLASSGDYEKINYIEDLNILLSDNYK
jgi:hypothetical protein